jgi:hypothetical protein
MSDPASESNESEPPSSGAWEDRFAQAQMAQGRSARKVIDPVIVTAVSFHDQPVIESGATRDAAEVDLGELTKAQEKREERQEKATVKQHEKRFNRSFLFPLPCGRRRDSPECPFDSQGFLFPQPCWKRGID